MKTLGKIIAAIAFAGLFIIVGAKGHKLFEKNEPEMIVEIVETQEEAIVEEVLVEEKTVPVVETPAPAKKNVVSKTTKKVEPVKEVAETVEEIAPVIETPAVVETTQVVKEQQAAATSKKELRKQDRKERYDAFYERRAREAEERKAKKAAIAAKAKVTTPAPVPVKAVETPKVAETPKDVTPKAEVHYADATFEFDNYFADMQNRYEKFKLNPANYDKDMYYNISQEKCREIERAAINILKKNSLRPGDNQVTYLDNETYRIVVKVLPNGEGICTVHKVNTSIYPGVPIYFASKLFGEQKISKKTENMASN